MRDVNKPLRQAYFTALQGTGENVYYMQAPDDLTGSYIVYSSPNGLPVPMKSGSKVTVNMQVTIYTEAEKYNSGDDVDTIAEAVYYALYPNPSFKLPLLTGFVMVKTDMLSDTVNRWTSKNQVIAIDRTIVFSHEIFIQ